MFFKKRFKIELLLVHIFQSLLIGIEDEIVTSIIIISINKNMIHTNAIRFIKFIVIINYNLTCSIIVCIINLHTFIL